MTTPPPDTKVQSKTLEQIAAQIVAMYYPDDDELGGAILSALRNERERACRLLCPFCGHDDYNLIFHHEEWRHYRKTDNQVQYCQASILRGKDGNRDAR